VFVGLVFLAKTGGAEDAKLEIAAKKALKAAESDYLAMSYAAGAARLKKAAAACGSNGCSALTRAALVCDLGTMLYRKGDRAGATKTWKIAVKISPDILPNPAYEQKDLSAAFVAATIGPPPSGGDFAHTPPIEQKTGTPLPVYFTGGAGDVAKVKLNYLPPAGSDWKSLDLKKVGSGWGGSVPCGDVTVGYLRYYVDGLSSHGSPAGKTGDSQHVFVVPIREQINADPPHLPGKAPPKSCSDSGEDEGEKPAAGGASGEPAKATEPSGEDKPAKEGAKAEEEPKTGEKTGEGEPPPETSHQQRKIWIGLAFGMDFALMPSGTDLCHINPALYPAPNAGQPTDPNHLYCTASDGADFPSRDSNGVAQNNTEVPGQAGNSAGGLQPGNARLLVSFDYVLSKNLLLGARAGVVFFTYPGQAAVADGRASPFDRLHLELRGTWLFGDNPLAVNVIAPLAFFGGGISNFSVSTSSTVTLNNGLTGPVNIWKTDGPGFVTAGGGVRWAPIEQVALTAAVRANLAFGNDIMWAFGPEIGAAYGF
jgi:hypothetical protein